MALSSPKATGEKTAAAAKQLSRDELESVKKFMDLLARLDLRRSRETFQEEFEASYGELDPSSRAIPHSGERNERKPAHSHRGEATTTTTTATSAAGNSGAPVAGAASPPSAKSATPAATAAAKATAASPNGPAADGLPIARANSDIVASPFGVGVECTDWAPTELGVVVVDGRASDLWECEDYNNERAPSFKHGAGLTQKQYAAVCKAGADTELVPCSPYMKAPPPTSLPLESFDLRVIYEAGKTGFEGVKEFPIVVGSVIAGRYQVTEYLGSAAFSRAVQCIDLKHGHQVCIKIIRNSKDFFDQSLDEIKLLQFINAGRDPDEVHVLQLYDYFYYKEHMFLVCELLRDNLYEFAKFNRDEEAEFYFTLPRIQSIARQVLTALEYLHSLNLLHCDLKPENILIKSYSRCEVKVIDFGSSCFTSDMLSSYIQSRCYRAPEVILGCKYDGRIDVWSLGAILPELITGHVLFHCESVPGMLARIAAILGPFPASMLHQGRHTCRFVTKHGVFYELSKETEEPIFHFPVRTRLAPFLGTDDRLFADFVAECLTVDHTKRPTAGQLLQHAFLKHDYGAAGTTPTASAPGPVAAPMK